MKKALFSMLVIALIAGSVSAQAPGTGAITGKLLTVDGRPVADAMVYFFDSAKEPAPDYNKYWKIPDDAVNTNNKGEFSISLPEGKYYTGGIKRAPGREGGPPETGDLFYNGADGDGRLELLVVTKGKTLDMGIVTAAPFRGVVLKDKITAIEGRVLFEDGLPAEGASVFAFPSPSMQGRPAFVSGRTGKDGAYSLRVYGNWNYYLRARNMYGGGTLAAGDFIGIYGRDKDTADPVAVKKGEITRGIDITVSTFKGRGPKKK